MDKHLKDKAGVWDLLVERWETFPQTANQNAKVMWDIALIEAILRPDPATPVVVGAPIIYDAQTVEQYSDNNRRITVFKAIDAAGMARHFWKAIDAAIDKGKKSE